MKTAPANPRFPRLSLVFKLLGAFLLVIGISALVMALLTARATQEAFRLYTTQNSQAWARRLAPVYADYYAQANTWEGVEAFVGADESLLAGMPGMGGGMRRGQGQGMGGSGSNGWMGEMGQRLILADAAGLVLLDTGEELAGELLSRQETLGGAPVRVDGNLVGYLVVTPAGAANDPSGVFLASVNRSILVAVAVAGGISFGLALIISLQITAPIRRMQKAAGAIARGDLTQRVPNPVSNDELGDLSLSFNRMAGSLAGAEEQRRRLLADVAHELRTPLAAIRATSEGILDGVLPLDAAQVEDIQAETLLLGRLIDDLRLISLAEAGELRLERHPTDLAPLLERAAERLRPQCQAKGIELVVDLAANLPWVDIDPDRIGQVIHNLVSNALRYTPPGGRICLTARLASGGGVEVSVADTGAGIPAGDLPHIFDRFYRADKSRARGSGGSGLGLAIVRQLVEAHGGRVAAESPAEGGKGSRISFWL
jgi:two-component system OmpR family sensor kinase/two-component system sensor histidine kinase BaeS